MFHMGMWRERMRNALTAVAEGRTPDPPPPLGEMDEFNDVELANGIGTPLADAAARSDHLLAEIIALYEKLGDRPFQWYRWSNTTDALLGNSYTHPRDHIFHYLVENDDAEAACRVFEDALPEMIEASETPAVQAVAHYNVACARVVQGRVDEALAELEQAFDKRTELRAHAAQDADLAALRENPLFQDLVRTRP